MEDGTVAEVDNILDSTVGRNIQFSAIGGVDLELFLVAVCIDAYLNKALLTNLTIS